MTAVRTRIPPQTLNDNGARSPDFWNKRFTHGETPWDQAGVSSAFCRFALTQPQPLNVLIPGCGSAHEALWLAQRGWRVRAIDFAPIAIETARSNLGAHRDCVELADFFRYEPPFTPQWIFERAFLCALSPAQWPAYAERMAALLPTGGWLAGCYLLGEASSGPPFGVEREALGELLASSFDLVDERGVTDSVAVFAGQERWFTWRRR
ncbi:MULTISPECIES: methyltransferase domain-containing protein [Paraburkholderia]|uniref:methyltransferase domain-containing protein n=1 Tax=Paraburkholderia TaxID=1822464 RepID=UPI002253448E|nr:MULTISPECIES: methyltransferase domain-containing protein [Paraburkholderia]MCX4162783.1 methyltransferase domain-containing protein [Paraburkholderia megapolitana]MDN7158278.1 TPMT family class I SAM-dependent methyltransferase [Paraburkholderia sp. CHISQ3]MDQ6495325.1 TPMT family class I SAM-dependent methyltransferase [Paraburkholderia megapolitana]